MCSWLQFDKVWKLFISFKIAGNKCPRKAENAILETLYFKILPGSRSPDPTRAIVIETPNKYTFAMALCSLYELHLSKYVRNFSHNMGLNISDKKEIACNY